MSDTDKKDDATHVGGGPPVMPKLPAGGPAASPAAPPPAAAPPAGGAAEGTERGGGPPVLPGKVAPPPHPGAAAAPPPTAAGEGEETIAIGSATPRVPFSLQRVQPPGHTGVVYLASETYLMGRKRGADLPLFSPTASREHARLERRPDGWYVEPCAGKTVIANGSIVHGALRLEHKMRLQIGGDELIFFDESVAVAEVAPARPAAAPSSRGRGRWIAVAIGLAVVAAMLVWLLLSARG